MPYYLCEMITDPGGGTDTGPAGDGRLPRVSVNLSNTSANAVCSRDLAWCVVQVPQTVTETAVIIRLDARTYGSLTATQRNRLNSFCDNRGIPRAWITSSTTLLEIAIRFARYCHAINRLNANGRFSVSTNLTRTIAEVPADIRAEAERWFRNLGVNVDAWTGATTLATVVAEVSVQLTRWRVRFGGEDLR